MKRLIMAFPAWAALWAASSVAAPTTANVSIGSTATATPSDFGGVASRAIDGNRDGAFWNGSVYYSQSNVSPLFYEVDLGTAKYIERVQLLRRTDEDHHTVGDIRLTIFEDDGAGGHGAVAFQQDYLAGYLQTGSWGTTDPGAAIPGGARGRHVRLERIDPTYGNRWLAITEFEVIGSSTPLVHSEANNLAAGKPVTVTSTAGYGSVPGSGNDGDVNATFGVPGNPVYHSAEWGVGTFWQVDLQANFKLDYLELFTRSDSYTTKEFRIAVLDENLVEVGSRTLAVADPKSAAGDFDHVIDVSGLTGRYLRLETTQNDFLSFAEFRAFAAVPEPSAAVLIVAASAMAWRRRAR